MTAKEVNSLVLAYLGDVIYEGYVRRFLISKGYCHVDELQKHAVTYVSAKHQAEFLKQMIDCNFLLEEELDVVKRARNYKTTSHPKNCDIITYKYATGLLMASIVVDSLVDKKTLSKEDYIKFLSAGSSQYSLDLLKILNIDLVNTNIIESGFNVMAEDIKKLQKVLSLNKK